MRLVWLSSTANNGWASVNELQVFGGDAFVLGQTKPTAANTGAGIVRPYPTRVLNGDQIITVAGTRIDDAIIHGRVIVKAPNVVISNCVIDGGDNLPGNAWALVDANRSANLRIEYSTIFAKRPTTMLNGIGMRNYTAYRVNVYGVVDAFSSAPEARDGVVNVSIQGSYGHDLVHFAPDPAHPATPTAPSRTHNDVLQSHGGRGLQVIGCNFAAYHHPTLGTQPAPHEQLAAIMVNTHGSLGHSAELDIRDNWFGGGVYCINAGGAVGGSGAFLRNRFDRGAVAPAGKPDESFTLVFDVLFALTHAGNVYEDTGRTVKVRTNY